MEQAEDWKEVENLKQQLGEVPKKHTIFRLPAFYNETNKHLYEPKMVAIGPYHHNKESLKAMEQHKLRSLKNIIGHIPLSVYIDKVKTLEERAGQCYSEHVEMGSTDFVRMLVLDGCFIIDYFKKWKEGNVDPICNETIVMIAKTTKITPCLNYSADHLEWYFSTKELIPPKISCKEIHHLLQLYYQCMVPIDKYHIDYLQKDNYHIIQMEQPNMDNGESHSIFSQCKDREKDSSLHNVGKANKISCVSELHEAGVTFKEKQNPIDMFDITFKNGIMEIPFLKVEDFVILWSMLAFEQSKLLYNLPILSSYLALMDSLINTVQDVTLLERAGVVENYLHSNEYAAELFNQFSKSFVLDYSNHYYQNLFHEVKRYSNSTWHKYKARLKHDYFSNPWTTISVLAAGLLLLLTAAQTYYSSKSTK